VCTVYCYCLYLDKKLVAAALYWKLKLEILHLCTAVLNCVCSVLGVGSALWECSSQLACQLCDSSEEHTTALCYHTLYNKM
jgi:hypothetical protein